MPPISAPTRDLPPEILQAGSLAGLLPNLLHGFSTNFYFQPNPAVGEAMRVLIADRLGLVVPPPVLLEQPHSANILEMSNGRAALAEVVKKGEHGTFLKGYDGVTGDLTTPAVLGVRAADCVPVLAVQTELKAYAAIHAGWRGTAAGILPNLLKLWDKAGGQASAVRLAFGPSIRACCFEVREDCLSQFEADHLADAVSEHGEARHLDLVQVLLTQARANGISEAQVEVLPYCTFCHQAAEGAHPFASYRRSSKQKQRTDGRNVAFIGTAG